MVQMNESLMNKYIKQIEELLFEEGKIVTYKSLSRLLRVNVNTSKQLMYAFRLQSKGEWQDLISCTYLVSGVKHDGSHLIAVANEKDLSELKTSLKETRSEHVFSLQKMPSIEDFNVLVGVEKFPSDSSISPIKCSESLITVEPTIAKAPTVAHTLKKEVKEPVPKQEAKSPLKSKPESVRSKATTSGTDGQKDKNNERNPSKKTGASITSMFSAQNQKAKTAAEEKKKNEGTAKASSSVVEENSKKEPAKESDKVTMKETKKDVEKSKGKPVSKSKEKKTSKKKEGKKPQDKKRKRIQVFSDSEDSDEDAAREKSPSPEPEPELETEAMIIVSDVEDEVEPVTTSGHKRKKRKIVDKHVMNEDGYMETKKEVVFETDSEPDETPGPSKTLPPVKKSPPETVKKAPAAKPMSPTKKGGKGKQTVTDGKKQASLLSFFKKN